MPHHKPRTTMAIIRAKFERRKREDVQEMAKRLESAYSTDRYKNGWAPSIRMLRRRGYSDPTIEAIICSKWTRWAGDVANKNSDVTAQDLEKYIVKYTTPEQIVKLTTEHFASLGGGK